MRRFCNFLALHAALVIALFGPTGEVRASAPPAAWAPLAHTSFRHHLDTAVGVGTALTQDHTGFIWLGTQTGLVRWDGLRMRRYQADAARPGALPDSYILTVRVDQKGQLWVGTSSGGLARYDAPRDAFVTIGKGPGGLSNARVSALADDGAGGIWVGTGNGLERVGADGKVHASDSGAPQIAGSALPKGGVEALLRDRSGMLWVGTRQGLWRRAHENAPLTPVLLAGGQAKEPAINSLYQDGAGRIWIGTRTSGAYVQHTAAAAPVAVIEQSPEASLQGERIFSIVESAPDVIWLGTEGGGIVEVDIKRQRTRRIRHQPDVADSLVDNDVVAMLRERGGQIFVATIDALSQHDPRPEGVFTVRSVGGSGKLSVGNVLVHPDGRAWLGIVGGASAIVDPRKGKVGELTTMDGTRQGGLPKGRMLAIANGPDGTVFIGTQQGLFSSDADGRNVRRIEVPSRNADASVWALTWRDGVLWLGGLDGVWELSFKAGAAPQVLRHEDSVLGDARVTAILPLDDGIVWIGTRSGLARLDQRSGKVELLPTAAADPTRLPDGYVSSLLIDGAGRLWVSTFSSGIALLERTDVQGRHWFRRFGAAEGLPDNGVNVIIRDRSGLIWLSTDNGVASIDPVSFAVRRLGAGDGVHIPAYWSGAGALSADGDILLGGLSGLTVVRAGALRRQHYDAPLALTQLTLGGRELPPVAFNGAASAMLTVPSAERERGVSLEFSALDFEAPEARRYDYRLDGFDPEWIETDAKTRRVNYTNLPPGDYTLQLRSTRKSGGAPATRAVQLRVLPAWHQRTSVRGLAVFFMLVLGVVLMQARTSLLRRRQRELETTVAERTAELTAIQARLETMAYSDALTGLPNRRLFNDELRRMAAQAQRDGIAFGLLLIDLDHFKAVNDTLGHDAGDALLVTAAERLRAAVREGDRVARLGGDEFAVLLAPGSDPATIGQVCQRIVESMAQPIVYGATPMRISSSVGAALFKANEASVETLYKMADVALYRAKEAGRGRWHMSGNAADIAA